MFGQCNEKEKEKMEKRIFYANNLECKESGSDESDSSSEEPVESSASLVKPGGRKREANLHRLWDQGGPVKLYTSPGDGAFTITFNNYKKLKYKELLGLLKNFGQYLSIRELDGNYVRVRFETEEEIRKCYRGLKMDPKFEVFVLLDIEEYKEFRKKEKKRRILDTIRRNNIFPECKEREDFEMTLGSDLCEKALQIEAGIEFGPSLGRRPKKGNIRREERGEEEKAHDYMVGTWNGNVVVVPEQPFVNKHLEPPPSYLKWKYSTSQKFLISSTDGSKSHRKGRCVFENRRTDFNTAASTVKSKPLGKSVEKREADSSSCSCDGISHGRDFSKKVVHAHVPERVSGNCSYNQSNADCSEISRFNTPKIVEYSPAADSTSSMSECSFDSTSQTQSEEIISRYENSHHLQNGIKQSIHLSSKSPNTSHGKKSDRINGYAQETDTVRYLSHNKVSSASESMSQNTLQTEPSGYENYNKYSAPRPAEGYDLTKEERRISPTSPTVFSMNNAYNNQKHLYKFSEQSSDSSLSSGSFRGEEINSSSSTDTERLRSINKNYKNRDNYFNKGPHKLYFTTSENMSQEKNCSTYNRSDNNNISKRKSIKDYDEQIPPLISIFDLYAFWLRKSVFEMI